MEVILPIASLYRHKAFLFDKGGDFEMIIGSGDEWISKLQRFLLKPLLYGGRACRFS